VDDGRVAAVDGQFVITGLPRSMLDFSIGNQASPFLALSAPQIDFQARNHHG